jgi:hypothetical protein
VETPKAERVLRGIFIALWLALVGAVVILASVPPTGKDALVHHLAVPKLYLKHGGIYEIPHMVFSYYPMNLDLLYMIPLAFGNDIAPKFIHFSFALLTAWLLFHYLQRRMETVYSLIGVILFLSTPIILKLSMSAYVDLGVVFFSTGALLLMLKWLENDFTLKDLMLSALLCGLALGTKYNALVTCFLLVLFIPFLYSRHAKGKKAGFFRPMIQALIFLSIAFLMFSPWMARNYYWKKNPIYPLYDGWFRGLHGSTQTPGEGHPRAGKFILGVFTERKLFFKEKWWETALVPVRIFFQGKDGDPQYFDGKLNPFLLILPLFSFMGQKRDPPLIRTEKRVLLFFSVLYFAFAFFTNILRIRYIAPIIPPLVILSAYGVRNMAREIKGLSNRRWRVPGFLALCLGLSLFMGMNVRYLVAQFGRVDPVGYITGQVTRDDYLKRHVYEYPALKYMNAHLPVHSKTLLLFLGDRGYYCDRPYVLDRGDLYRFVKTSSREEQVLFRLRERGITHLLIRYDIFDKWKKDKYIFNDDELDLLNQFMTNCTKLLFFKWGYGVSVLTGVSSEPSAR